MVQNAQEELENMIQKAEEALTPEMIDAFYDLRKTRKILQRSVSRKYCIKNTTSDSSY